MQTILYGLAQNNPKQRKIILTIDGERRCLGKIQTLPEGGVCFYPIKISELWFLGNGQFYNWPLSKHHVTFHNSGRAHIGKEVIFDYGKHKEDTNKVGMHEKRNSIGDHKPQTLFKLKIPSFHFLETVGTINEPDVLLTLNDTNAEIFFSCGIFDGKNINEAKKTGIDQYGVLNTGHYLNTKIIPFGSFCDAGTQLDDSTKFLFLVIRPYEHSEYETSLSQYPYLLSVSQYNEEGSTPY